ncbi:MAG: hypothetical protein NVSMB47_07330 [Polyangiales bacterium]
MVARAPGAGVFVAAIVVGTAIGVGAALMRQPRGAGSAVTATATTSGTTSGTVPIATGGGAPVVSPRDAAPEAPESWVDLLDPTQPPPESQTDPDYLLSLVTMKERDSRSIDLAKLVIGGRRHRANQGNYKITHHEIARKQCLEGLRGIELQTPAQREICGHPNEVPIHHGDLANANTCIDVFEYPNKACELPFAHLYGTQAEQLCALDGKRLCTDDEWDTACEADPSGGPSWTYAYGNELDLSICDTGKAWPPPEGPTCKIDDDLWNTCATNTEPSGAFPKCRSRLGVFDQHGNVAELMHRWEGGVDYIQMKGSAFFYDGKMYRDHCRFDPRWHVDPFKQSWHDNYHLGFRCCRSVKSLEQRALEANGAVFGADAAPPPPLDDYDQEIADAGATPAHVPAESSSSGPPPIPSNAVEDPYK